MYFYQNCKSVYNFWCLLPSRPSNHMVLDNSHNSKFCITRWQNGNHRFAISTMYFYQNCMSVYNLWYLLPPRPSNHKVLDNTQVTQASTLRDCNEQICLLRSPPCIKLFSQSNPSAGIQADGISSKSTNH